MKRIGTGSLCALMCAVLVFGLASVTCAATPSWDAFQGATLDGVSVVPQLVSGVQTYIITLGLSPTVTLPTGTYALNWVQGVFALSGDPAVGISATDGGNDAGWVFGKSGPDGITTVAGWSGDAMPVRLLPGDSMEFKFNPLTYGDSGIILGFHVGYTTYVDGAAVQNTEFVKPVPEPSSLLALLSGIGGVAGLAIRRRRQ